MWSEVDNRGNKCNKQANNYCVTTAWSYNMTTKTNPFLTFFFSVYQYQG